MFLRNYISNSAYILGVSNKTSNVGIYGELGKYPMSLDIVQKGRRYYIHLDSNTENLLLKRSIKCLRNKIPPTQISQHINFNKTISKFG